jgi:DHA1 family purine base/nucleoside efflux pump-like MFS transporter
MLRPVPLLALTAATFSVGLGELAVAGILPPLAGDMHVTIPVAGQLIGLYALLFAVLTPPLAAVFGGARRKRGLVIGLTTVALANIIAAAAPDYLVLLGSRLLAAAGSALVSPLALSLIDDVVTLERRGRAQGIVFAGFSVAMTVGVPLGALIADQFGWRWVFAGIALSCALAALLGGQLRIEHPATPAPAWSLSRSGLTPAVVRLLAISFLILAAQYTVFTYLRPYITETGGYGVAASAFLLFLLGAFGIVGNIAGGFAFDRWGAKVTIVGCVAANIALFIALRCWPGPLPVTAVLFALWAIASWAYSPSVNVELSASTGEGRDVALALNMTAFNLGIAGGSALGGAVIVTSGISNVVVLGAVLLVPALALSLTLPARRRLPPPSEHCS